MRKSIITGVAVSAVLHAGFVFGSNLFPKDVIDSGPKKDDEKIKIWVAPQLPPEPVDEVEKVKELKDDHPVSKPVPEIQDHPRAVIDDDFTQLIEAPKPQTEGIDSRTIPIDMPTTGPGPLTTVFRPDQLQRNPEALSQAAPAYPYVAIQDRLEGKATVSFIVTSSGQVVDAHAVGSTDRVFEQPAVDAVMRWKFRAGIKDNHAVNTRMVIEINFTLDK